MKFPAQLSKILLFALFLAFFVFALAAPIRFTIWHFENGGYVLDSGWFATLLETTDPMMPNPKSIYDHSFYAHHISPILLIIAWLNNATFNLNGIYVFAILNGISLAGAFALMSAPLLKQSKLRTCIIALIGLAILFLTNEYIYRAIGYPHYELIYLFATAAMLSGLYLPNRLLTALGCLLFLLTREDGGLFAAYLYFCSIVMRSESAIFELRRFLVEVLSRFRFPFTLGLFGIVGSFATMWLQRTYFPEFGTFSGNFAGDNFSHVTGALFFERLRHFIFEAGGGPLVLAVLVLSLVNRRNILPFVLMSPLILLHLIAAREVLAFFQVHYALPFIIILMVCVYDTITRKQTRGSIFAAGLIAGISVLTSAPFAGWIGQRQNADVYVNLAHFSEVAFAIDKLDNTIQEYTAQPGLQHCGSIGAVAFEPGSFDKVESLEGTITENCSSLLLFQGDLFYNQITSDEKFQEFELMEKNGKLELYRRAESNDN